MLKIMTLNLNYYGTKYGSWPVRKELIREVILTSGPDILALQAVKKDPQAYGGADQASQLAELLAEYSTVLFQPAMDFDDASLGGSAFLARAPVAGADHLALTLLPSLEDNQRRAVLHARFDLPGGALHVFNAHFSWVAEQARLNIEETLPYLQRFEGPAILVGDLNTPSGSALLRRFSEAGWRDIWAVLRPEEAGYTFESGDPSLRIDYAWANPLLQPQVRDIEIVATTQGANGARPSDHFGLLVNLSLDA